MATQVELLLLSAVTAIPLGVISSLAERKRKGYAALNAYRKGRKFVLFLRSFELEKGIIVTLKRFFRLSIMLILIGPIYYLFRSKEMSESTNKDIGQYVFSESELPVIAIGKTRLLVMACQKLIVEKRKIGKIFVLDIMHHAHFNNICCKQIQRVLFLNLRKYWMNMLIKL